ncbi:hypothetical protein PLIIFM63780_001769 [Purpureocillium lilacinum]|nr:hypothetical protein PLIIFM63780_001769 [Purpureocillium lilacinum]
MVALIRVAVSLALLAVARAAPAPLADRATPAPPSKDPFYAVPDNVESAAPGTILQHRSPPNAIAAFGALRANLQASHQFLYRTTDNHGNATATVLTVLVPHNADKSKVLSYQVAEDASSIDCAPSYALQLESATGPLLGTLVTQAELLLMEAALEQGWVVIVPDFLGPQGAYLANALAGHAVLDGIRAALNSADITGIRNPTVAMWGYSGGSVATNWAAELHPTYAPELKIAGAAVGGTVPNITNVVTTINKGPFAGFIPTGVLGLSAQYPELKTIIDQHLKPQYVEKFHKPLKQCLVADAAEFLFADVVGMFDDRSLIYTNPTAVRVLRENALGKATPTIPFFWYKSVLDEVSPIGDTDALVSKYCAAGVSVEYVRDIVSEHGSYAVIGAPKALSWLKDIMEGQAPRKGCSKKTTLSTLLDPATFEILPKFLIDALLDLLGKPVGPILFG